MEQKDFAGIGRDILFASRNELYMSLPYLDAALCALRFEPGADRTMFIAADWTRPSALWLSPPAAG